MADDDAEDETEEEEAESEEDEDDEEEGGLVAKLLGNKLVLIGGGVGVVAIIGVVVAVLMMGGGGEGAQTVEIPEEGVLFELPVRTVDLKVGDCRGAFLKFEAVVEVSGVENQTALDENKDQVMEAIQLYIRTLNRKDLVGTEGSERLRHELEVIINRQLAPARVMNVLFRQFVLQ